MGLGYCRLRVIEDSISHLVWFQFCSNNPPKTSKDYCTRLHQVHSGMSFSKIPRCSFPSLRRFCSLRRKCRKWRWGLWYGRGHTRLIGGAFGVSKPWLFNLGEVRGRIWFPFKVISNFPSHHNLYSVPSWVHDDSNTSGFSTGLIVFFAYYPPSIEIYQGHPRTPWFIRVAFEVFGATQCGSK